MHRRTLLAVCVVALLATAVLGQATTPKSKGLDNVRFCGYQDSTGSGCAYSAFGDLRLLHSVLFFFRVTSLRIVGSVVASRHSVLSVSFVCFHSVFGAEVFAFCGG